MTNDPTEMLRRRMVSEINEEPSVREALEVEHGVGNVWDTEELQETFSVTGFMAPFTMVRRKSDGVEGVVMFQHNPRFYFDFIAS